MEVNGLRNVVNSSRVRIRLEDTEPIDAGFAEEEELLEIEAAEIEEEELEWEWGFE